MIRYVARIYLKRVNSRSYVENYMILPMIAKDISRKLR